MKPKMPSWKVLRHLLSECLTNPKPGSPLAIVVGFNDPIYCERKAMEFIAEAQLAISQVSVHSQSDQVEETWKQDLIYRQEYDNKIRMAVYLLTVARAQRGPVETTSNS